MLEVIQYLRLRAVVAKSERGASAVEYGLLVALIAIAIIAAVTLLGGQLKTVFTDSCTKIGSGVTSATCS